MYIKQNITNTCIFYKQYSIYVIMIKMKKILIYRHAKPIVSENEVILGKDYPSWVKRYNESEICLPEKVLLKENFVFTSKINRSIKTGKAISKKTEEHELFNEAEVPLIRFPKFKRKAKFWIVISRILWMYGISTKCESYKVTKKRVTSAIEFIDSYLKTNNEVIIVGHGFINHMLKKQLSKKGWQLSLDEGHDYLSKMIFEF
jgi:broad specificity phosphatase PhoE